MNQKERNILITLIKCAKENTTIYYSDLWSKPEIAIGRAQIGRYLSTVGHYCQNQKLPKLTSLVIKKYSNSVSEGYFIEFYPKALKKEYKNIEIKDRQECFNYNKWEKVLKEITSTFI